MLNILILRGNTNYLNNILAMDLNRYSRFYYKSNCSYGRNIINQYIINPYKSLLILINYY